MPQKKNPDVPELARGKAGRVNGNLVALLTLMKGQPLATTRTTRKTRKACSTRWTRCATLTIFADMAGGIKVKADNMRAAALQGFATATDLADYLVKRGLPFRDAHEVVAHAVRDCEQRGCDLADLTLAELQPQRRHRRGRAPGADAGRLGRGPQARGRHRPERVAEEARRVLAGRLANNTRRASAAPRHRPWTIPGPISCAQARRPARRGPFGDQGH